MLRWTDLGNDRVGMLADNGLYLSAGADGVVRADAMEMEERETFTIVNSTGSTKSLRAVNGMYLTVKGDGTVVADGATLDKAGKFTLMNMAPRPSLTTLAFYDDKFMLTGCYFEECHGTDVGVFWTDTQKDALATSVMMAYNFLHNATTGIEDMTSMLTDEGTSFDHTYRSFDHRDLAMQALATEMLPAARDALPAGDSYPIITIMTDGGIESHAAQFAALIAPYVVARDCAWGGRYEMVRKTCRLAGCASQARNSAGGAFM